MRLEDSEYEAFSKKAKVTGYESLQRASRDVITDWTTATPIRTELGDLSKGDASLVSDFVDLLRSGDRVHIEAAIAAVKVWRLTHKHMPTTTDAKQKTARKGTGH